MTARAMESEVLQDDRGPCLRRESHESLGDPVKSLADSMPLPPAFVVEKEPGDHPVFRLLLREPLSASEMNILDAPDAVERHPEETGGIARRMDPVHRIFVRIQGDCCLGLVRLRRLLPHDDDDLPWDEREGSEAP